MADPSSEEDGVLREWAPLTALLQQIPLKAQRGLFTHDLNLTCVDTLPEFIAVGTNLGLVYWYNRKKGDLQRLRCENTGSAITCVKIISTVDFMVAAGNDQGIVTVFQIPKIPPDNLPESMKPKKNKQVERYTISGLHTAPVTAIEWSMNGMKLFSGDKNGLVVLTEIDFYMHLSKSVELLNEKYEIIQLSYSQQLLLVSTLYRSIVCCHREDRWKVAQVGQKERKSLGRLGATFCLGSGRPQELVVYASRPGLRVWLADKNGVVQQTLIYKDALISEHTNTPLINPAPAHVRQSRGDHQFGPLLVFRENLLVTYSSDVVYVLNPASITVVATVGDVRKVQDVAVNKDEIFILEGERSLIRVAYTPESSTIMPDMDVCYGSSTDALVHIMCSPEVQLMLADKSVPKRTVWGVVTTDLEMLGFSMGENGAERCKQKWNNIVRNYHHYARTRKFDVKAHRPLYYNKLEELFNEQKQTLNDSNISAGELTVMDLHGAVRGYKRKLDDCEESTDSKLPYFSKRGQTSSVGDVSSSDLPLSSASSDEEYSKHFISESNLISNSFTEHSNKEELVVVYPDIKSDVSCDKLDNEEVVMLYSDDLGNYTVVDHNSSEEGIATNIPSSACMSPEKSALQIEMNKSIDFLKKSRPGTSKMNRNSTIVISPKPNQPARPIPTAGEAMMSLIIRLSEEEIRKERGKMRRREARLDKLENLLREQNAKRRELLEAALLILDDLKDEDVGSKFDYQTENVFLPVSLPDITVPSSILDLTSKLKDSAIVSAIPLPKISSKINIFTSPGAEYEGTNSQIIYDTSNPVVTADEATELPPVIALPPEDLVGLNISRIVSPGVDCVNATMDGNKVFKEVYNISQRSNSGSRRNSTLSCDNSRTELLDRIGEQQYEDVLFRPKHKKRKNKTRARTFVSGAESGSDTMSTNSIRSTSDGEDPWSSERLDISSDWSTSTRHSEGNKRSSSEETLVRLGDCISSDLATLPGDNCSEHDGTVHENSTADEPNMSQKIKDKRPSDLHIGEECSVPPEIQPDLRSPASIERDVASKERILAKVLKLDTLCDGDPENEKGDEHDYDIKKIETTEFIGKKTNVNYVTSHSCVLSDEMSGDQEVVWENRNSDEDTETISEAQDEKLASITSILSYGPPSGSSAPPSHHASLEICTPDLKVESSCENGVYEAVERPDRWMQYKVPGTVSNFVVCKYYVCCVDCKEIVYFSALNGLSLTWHKVDYKAKQLSISPNGTVVWKIHKNIAYALDNPSTKGPFGGKWKEAAHNVQWISVSENMAWFISDGCIFVQKHLNSEHPCNISSSPVHCNQPVTKISSFQGTVIALTSLGEVLIRMGISHIVPEGKEWKKIVTPCPVVTDIALGISGTTWVVDQKNYVYFSCNVLVPDAQWWQVLISDIIFQQTRPMQQFRNKLTENYLSIRQQASVTVAAGEDTVWITDKCAINVYMNKTEFTGHQWSKMVLRHHIPSLKWRKICAEGIFEDKGQLWLLSSAGDFFSCRPNSQTFHGLPLPDDSPIVCVAAAIDTVWVLTDKGKIYIRQGVSDSHPDGSTWKPLNLTQIGGIHFKYVSCGCDVVWACDSEGDAFMAVGPPHTMAGSTFSPVWIPVDDKLQRKYTFTKVFVGPQMYMVWAVDNKKNVYVREGVFNDFQIGTGWVLVSGIEAVELSISGTAVWALSPRGSIYRRYGITETNFIGDYWKKIPGSAVTLTASGSDGLWALDKNYNLLRHSQCTVRMNKDSTMSNVEVHNFSTDGDWEFV